LNLSLRDVALPPAQPAPQQLLFEPGFVERHGPVLIGYLRNCPGYEVPAAAQRRALAEAGCEQVVEEWSGLEHGDEQPELHDLLARLQPGDVVVVPRLDSLGRSLPKVVHHVQSLTAAGIGLRSLAEALDTPARPQAAKMIAVAGQGDSQVAGSRRRGAGGRPPKLSPAEQLDVVENVLSGRYTAAAMAKHYHVSPATISRLLAARLADAAAPAPRRPATGDGVAADRIVGVLPPSALDEWLAIVGTSGSGKTYAAKDLIERVMASGGRVCVVDPLGVWWGLARGADGAPRPSRWPCSAAPMPTCRSIPAWAPPSAAWSGRSRWPVSWTCLTSAALRPCVPS